MSTVTLVHDCDISRRGDGSAPADVGGDFRDCYIVSTHLGGSYDLDQFNAGIVGTGGEKELSIENALLWFDLNYYIPASATITNAIWHYQIWVASGSATHSYDIKRITQTGWVEGQTSWVNYKVGVAWATPGGDYADPTIIIGNMNSTGWQSTNILSMVSDAWANRSGICTFIIRRIDNDGDDGEFKIHAKNFYSIDPNRVPHLRIAYTLDERTFEAFIF